MELNEDYLNRLIEEFQCMNETLEDIAAELEIQNNLKRKEMEEQCQ